MRWGGGWGGGGFRGWIGPWPGRGPFSFLPPWQRPGWGFGRGACWWSFNPYFGAMPYYYPSYNPYYWGGAYRHMPWW